MEKVSSLLSKLFENQHLSMDLSFGRVNLQKLETIMNDYDYSLENIESSIVLYTIIDILLKKQRPFTPNPEIIVDFCKIKKMKIGIEYALKILKAEDRLHSIAIYTTSEYMLQHDLKSFYGETVLQTVKVGKISKENIPLVCTVYSEYYGTHISTEDAVRVYNSDTERLDWIHEGDSVEPVYYPKGFRLIDYQSVWIRNKGYVPRKEAAYSKWLGCKVWKKDPNLVFTGNDYVPPEDIEKYFLFISDKSYTRKMF